VQYAERFAAAGFVTLVFDYRYWGESSGEPRFHVAPMEFRTDIRAGIDFLAARPEVDANRIGGWGISMGGQNMLFLATWEPRFKAIVATATGIEPPVEVPLSPEGQRPSTMTWSRPPKRNGSAAPRWA
jgi:dienelactone hydrolase